MPWASALLQLRGFAGLDTTQSKSIILERRKKEKEKAISQQFAMGNHEQRKIQITFL